MPLALVLAGLGQIALALASLLLPRILRWGEETARLSPLTRKVFWVYAAYILVTNLCLGTLSVAAPRLLLDRSPLARCVAGYAAAYWGARLAIQLVWFRGSAPKGPGYAAADWAVTALFAFWAVVYGAIALDRW
jgi:hypothetical protein